MKSVNDLNILIEDYENNYDKLETENQILKQKSQFQEEKINELNNEISIKDRIINELKNQINNLESTVYKLKGFWNAIINRFKYMIFDEKMEKETIIVIQK